VKTHLIVHYFMSEFCHFLVFFLFYVDVEFFLLHVSVALLSLSLSVDCSVFLKEF